MYACAQLVDGSCQQWVQFVAPPVDVDASMWGEGFGVGFMLVFGFFLFGWGIGQLLKFLHMIPRA